ncbi:MAG: type II toxin-antitoxin system VapC family toxin [Candidatus Hadarchaeota archaeon]
MERPKEVVLDASVAVKWFSTEEGTDLAVTLRDEHINGHLTIVSPDLLVYEVSNALRYNPNFGHADVEEAAKSIFDIDLDLVPPNEEIFEKAAARAFEFGVTIYDGCYVALSELMGLELVTGDKKLYKKIEKLKFVKLLEQF